MDKKNRNVLLKFTVAAVFLMLNVTGCEKKENPFPDDVGGQIFQGNKIVNVKCSGCHGALGGGGMSAPKLLDYVKNASSEEFVETVIKGRGGMPPFDGLLKEDEVLQIIDWLKKLPS